MEVKKEDFKRMTLRLPADMDRKIEEIRDWRVGKISKNQWIVETLAKYLNNIGASVNEKSL